MKVKKILAISVIIITSLAFLIFVYIGAGIESLVILTGIAGFIWAAFTLIIDK